VGIGPEVRAEYENLGIPFAERGPRLIELLGVVRKLWSGEPVDHDRRFYDFDGASIGFGPARDQLVYVPTAAFDPTEGFPAPIRDRLVEHGDG
jgi:alkanesulfonate monooxygenase SsuD/methylene tetrahydromethanopterin reductase-like flavin-dependent oxidoreductase (luciferase family)